MKKVFFYVALVLTLFSCIYDAAIGEWASSILLFAILILIGAIRLQELVIDAQEMNAEQLHKAQAKMHRLWISAEGKIRQMKHEKRRDEIIRGREVKNIMSSPIVFGRNPEDDKDIILCLAEALLAIGKVLPEPHELEDPELREFYAGVISDIKKMMYL